MLDTSTTAATKSDPTSGKSLEALAKALGVDVETLQKQLQSGDTAGLRDEISKAFGTTAGIQFDSAL